MIKSLYIYGASGHGLVVYDIAKKCGYNNIIFIDDGDNYHPTFESIKNNCEIPMIFGIGDNQIRAKIYNKVISNGFQIISLIHPSCIISESADIGKGTVIMPNVVVNAKVTIGNGVILNTSSIIEHECVIENFVHISPNVAIAGAVEVGEYSHIGIGASIIQGLKIGKMCIIGAGSIVVNSITENKKAYGIPCKEIEDI